MGRYDYGYRRGGRYDEQRGYGAHRGPGDPPRQQARDEWWLGGHHPARYDRTYDRPYDRAYRAFDARHHPHFSPIGGTYPAMGGAYQYRRPPRPLRDEMWFSDWTRWF